MRIDFLSVSHINITSVNNCFEKLNLAQVIASVRPLVDVALSQDRREKVIRTTASCTTGYFK